MKISTLPIGCIALLALGSWSSVYAAPDAPTAANAPEPMVLAQLAPMGRPADAATAMSFPAGEAGVRKAAAEGNETLRRYVWRTRMIYNYYFPEFAHPE